MNNASAKVFHAEKPNWLSVHLHHLLQPTLQDLLQQIHPVLKQPQALILAALKWVTISLEDVG